MYKIDDGDSYDTGVGRAHSDNNEEGGRDKYRESIGDRLLSEGPPVRK